MKVLNILIVAKLLTRRAEPAKVFQNFPFLWYTSVLFILLSFFKWKSHVLQNGNNLKNLLKMQVCDMHADWEGIIVLLWQNLTKQVSRLFS